MVVANCLRFGRLINPIRSLLSESELFAAACAKNSLQLLGMPCPCSRGSIQLQLRLQMQIDQLMHAVACCNCPGSCRCCLSEQLRSTTAVLLLHDVSEGQA